MSDHPLLITPHYFPCIGYVSYLVHHPNVCLEVNGFYEKQTYRNRCHILTSQGVSKLIVPVCHTGQKQRYKESRIDYTTPWAIRHRRTLTTAYGTAPYFHALADMIFPILEKKPTFLLDLTFPLLEAFLLFLNLRRNFSMTTMYVANYSNATIDMREEIHPKKQLPLQTPALPHYRHIFTHPFTYNLSIIDLLFCEGPSSLAFLQ